MVTEPSCGVCCVGALTDASGTAPIPSLAMTAHHPAYPGAAGPPPPAAALGCLGNRLDALESPMWGTAPPPWAPGRREDPARMDRIARDGVVLDDRLVLLSQIDILADLTADEMHTVVEAAPTRTYRPGELLCTPHRPVQTLYLLKRGRIRTFRVSSDGRALTTAIVTAGTIFGEMVLLGQRMYDNYAEAVDETVTGVMSQADVRRLWLSDPRIATRIAELLGRRLVQMERRLFTTVPQRIAAILNALATGQPTNGGAHHQVRLTHKQLAALAGISRTTATQALGDLAESGLLRLDPGKITILAPDRLAAEAGAA